VFLLAFGAPNAVRADPSRAGADAPALALRGRALFAQHCLSCHGWDEVGGVAASRVALVNLRRRFSPAELTDLIAAPPPDMPRLPLTPAERKALVAYLLRAER